VEHLRLSRSWQQARSCKGYWETLNIQVEILVEPMFQGKVSRETRWKWPHVEDVFLCHEVWTSGKWVSYEGAWKVGTILKLGLI
jgi:hypothetical protein